MKKIFLVAAIGAAGLVSAKSAVVKSTATKEKTESKKETSNKTTAFGCVSVSYSCGVKGWACGSTTLEMLQNAWDGDALFCGG
ncbi:hypothetical protein MP478_06040 [Chryseobacterium sp. WG14]|uniref:hypothetical protein n=1 Tax=Chryseobacterium sp. WG14 TaxID=2926909 RepID=UPI00211EE121|nr:hypothetical protein [Chryseobacterium sp. WG14]MCQ9638946.1 hypothetical protein [Chryseobacterium sp. WG14]